MTFGTASRNSMHAMGTDDAVFTPRYEVVSTLVIAKDRDNLNRYAYRSDLLDWLSNEQQARFLRLGMVRRILPDLSSADHGPHLPAEQITPIGVISADIDADSGAATPDSSAVDACIAILDRLDVPSTAGAPACRTALRQDGYRYGNAVVAAAVKRRKHPSRTATDDDEFAVVVA